MASHKIRIRSAVTATLIAAQLGIANPIGVPHQYKAVGENMAVTLKNKEEKQQEKLAHDLYREYSKEKGIIHPQPAMFPKISENEYIEFIKEYNVKNKGEFLARLGEAAEKYRGGDINAGLANLRYGLADLTSSEKARQETLTPKEKRTEQRERASRDIKNTGIFKAIQESEGGVKIEVPEAPRIEVPVPTVKAEKPAEEELKPRVRKAEEKPAEEAKAPETMVMPEQRIVGKKPAPEVTMVPQPAPEIKEKAIVPSRKEAEKKIKEEGKRAKEEAKATERQAKEQEKAEKRIGEDNKRRDEQAAKMRNKEVKVAEAVLTDVYTEARAIFENDRHAVRKQDGGIFISDEGNKVYIYPENLKLIESFGARDLAELKRATGIDFIQALKDNENDTKIDAAKREFISQNIICRALGSMILYDSFIKAGVDSSRIDLSEYANNGFAENIGFSMDHVPLANQKEFEEDILNFIASHVSIDKNGVGKVTEIDAKENHTYTFVSIAKAYIQQFKNENISKIIETSQEKIKDIAELENVNKELKEKANQLKDKEKIKKKGKEKKASEQDKETLRGEIKGLETRKEQLEGIVGIKADDIRRLEEKKEQFGEMVAELQSKKYDISTEKKIADYYAEYRTEDIKRMAMLEEYIDGLKLAQMGEKNVQLIKNDFIRMLRNERAQMVILQTAIHDAFPSEKVSLEELEEKSNIWKNYKVLVLGKLKQITSYGLEDREKKTYFKTDRAYSNQLQEIYSKLDPEETMNFAIDLLDKYKAANSKMPYEEYVRAAIRDRWIATGCLDDFKEQFFNKYNISLAPEKVSDSALTSLIFDHKITPEEMDYIITYGGSLNVLNDKLTYAKANLETSRAEEHVAMRKAIDGAIRKLGIDRALFYDDIKGIFLARWAISDMIMNPDVTRNTEDVTLEWLREPKMGRDGKVVTDDKGEIVYAGGVSVLERRMDDLNRRGISSSYVGSGTVFLSSEEKDYRANLEASERANAYISMFNNEFFPLKENVVTLGKLKYFRNLVEIERDYITLLGKDEAYVANDPELLKACDKSLEFTVSRIDNFIQMYKNGDNLGNLDPGDQFLWDNILKGKMIVAGVHGWNVYDDMASGHMASVERQGFVPMAYYFMNNPELLDQLMGMKTPTEESMNAWKPIIMGKRPKNISKETVERCNRYFPQAYDYYAKKLGEGEKELKEEVGAIFGEEVLSNLERSVDLTANFYTYLNGLDKDNEEDRANINLLKRKLTLLFISQQILESPYDRLSSIERKKDDSNTMEMWKDGYQRAKEGIAITDRAVITKFLENLSASEWGKKLKEGEYTIEFEDDRHQKRSFDISVIRVQGGINITADRKVLEGIEKEPITLYCGDRMIMRAREDIRGKDGEVAMSAGSIALVSKSNTAILLMLEASKKGGSVGKPAYGPQGNVGMISLNFVPNGYHEQGIDPVSFYAGYYRAYMNAAPNLFRSDRTVALVENIASFNPIYEQKPLVAEKVTTPLVADQELREMILWRTSGSGGGGDAEAAAIADKIGFRIEVRGRDGTITVSVVERDANRRVSDLNELDAGQMQQLLNQLLPGDASTNSTNVQIRNSVMAMYYGTGPEFQKGAYNNQGIWVPERDGNGNNIYLNPDQKIELQVTPNGGYIIIAKDKTGATERREVITRESITNYLYGYPEDRFTAFLAQTGKLRIGDLEINLRAEEGMKPFTKKEKEAIVNAYLSSNIPGMEWTKSISKSAFESTKAYLILNFEDIFRRSRSISGGVGVTGTLTMPKVSFGLTGQVIEEYTPMMEKQWTTIPSINLTHTQILGQHFELYNSATVRYDIAEEKLKGTLSTGAAWKISEYWRIGGSGDWNWGPIDIWTANASIAYRKIKLEGSLSIQEDKLYGTNKFFNTRIVPSGQAKLIYDLGSTRRLGRK